jgi:Cu/Ag efflux protein CusF
MKTVSTLFLFLLLCVSCARMPKPASSQPERLYKLSGTVVRLDPAAKIATIKHDRILDDQGKVWMEPMTMDFPMRNEKEFTALQPGQKIRATVHQLEFDVWISGIETENLIK